MDIKEQYLKNIPKNLDKTPLFGNNSLARSSFLKDKDFLILTKKTERLVSATYLLTDLFPEQEPLKWSLRKCALQMIPETLSLTSITRGFNTQVPLSNSYALRLFSFLETSHMSGLISQMNFSILSNELLKLIHSQNEYVKNKGDNNKLYEAIFNKDDKGHNLDKISLPNTQVIHPSVGSDLSNLDNKNLKRQKEVGIKHSNPLTSHKSVVNQNVDSDLLEKKQKKNDRQIKILDMVRHRKIISIKDISDEIKDCSEKTIQRELMSMVKSGVLKKDGERRWSKYSLNL